MGDERIVYTRLCPRAGMALYPYIFIRPAWKFQTSLIEHERVHWRQQKEIGLGKWLYRYATDKAFRLKVEVEAYRVSLRHNPALDFYANSLATNYGLKITKDEARKLLVA